VTGKPRNGVGIGKGMGQAPGDFAQQLVSRLMAQAFVEDLEAVEVDIKHRQTMAAVAHTLACTLQTLLEQVAVAQPGQFVEAREVAHAFLYLTPGAEVGEKGHYVGYLASG